MPSLRVLVSKLKTLFSKQAADNEFNDEVQAHLLLLTERFVRQGMRPEDASAAARRQFGNVTLLQEDRSGIQTLASIETFWQDLRYGLRTLWKSRGFSAVAILTLALGIGASTAIFSVIENVLMEPFPYVDAGRLMFPRIHDMAGNEGSGRQGYTSREFLEFAEQNHVFDRVIAAAEEQELYKTGEGAEQFDAAHVTPGTFEFFGVRPLLGRVMQPADYEPGAPPVFVLRYKTWVNRFNRDPQVLNKTFILSGTPRTLIGIMPPRFAWFDADVFIPEKPQPGAGAGFNRWFMLGHLKPGVSVRQAEADLTIVANRLSKLYPQNYPTRFAVKVKPLGDSVVGRLQTTLYTVLAAVALLLLIGCGNVANLILARATAREKEFALRAVLGARRSRLVQQLLVESMILALAGTAFGTLLAWGGLKFIVAALPQDLIPAESVIELNAPVLGFTLCVAVLTALIFGLVPALQAARRDLIDPLRDSGKGASSGFRGARLRSAVVVLEVAMSLTLLIGAGLLMRSFLALREEHLGLHPDHILMTVLSLPEERYKTGDEIAGFFRPLLARLKALPGVVDATESSEVPPTNYTPSEIDIPGKAHEEKWSALLQLCGEGYFPMLRMEFKEGRAFTEAEVNGARKLAVVNETFARKYLRGENSIGAVIHVPQLETLADSVRDARFEIVGVIADAKNQGLQLPVEPEIWIPYTVTGDSVSGVRFLLVRTAQAPLAMVNAVRHEIRATDAGVAFAFPDTLEGFIGARSYAGPRFGFVLITIFGCIGLVLVTTGVYSVLAYTAARRTNEIAIRMALGAERAEVVRMVIRAGLRLVALGVVIGLLVSVALGRVLARELWGVSTYDPITLAGMAALLMTICVVACWIPARRAARVDPLVALRYE